MRNYIERAKDFIEQIYPYIKNFNSRYSVRDAVMEFNADHNRKVICNHGIARVAMITSDYVVKFDYDPDEVACVGGGEAEVRLYAQAERDGFAYLFAKVTRYEYSGRRFYIMPRIYGINESNWYYADHYMTDEENAWCDSHHLSDLHCNNYGFRKGKVCIVDYACTCEEVAVGDSSSYHSSSSWSSERS